MKNKLTIGIIMSILMLMLSVVATPSVEWQETSQASGADVIKTSDGGFIIVGATQDHDFWLLKLDSEGNQEWERTFHEEGIDGIHSISKTSDGGYIVVGKTDSFGNGGYDFWIVKTDSQGNMVWDKTFGGTGNDYPNSVIEDADNNYLIAGFTDSFGGEDVWLLKLDSEGNLIWEKTFGGEALDEAYSILQTPEGGYIMTGHTYSFGAGSGDMWLVKTSKDGVEEWSKTFGGEEYENGLSMDYTSDGGYILAGQTRSKGEGSADMWLVKTDSQGNMVWDKTFGGDKSDVGRKIKTTSDDGYIVAGYTHTFGVSDYADMWLVKVDSDGNKEWDQTFGEIGQHDYLNSVQETENCGYIVVGHYHPDFWVIKLEGECIGSGNPNNCPDCPEPDQYTKEEIDSMINNLQGQIDMCNQKQQEQDDEINSLTESQEEQSNIIEELKTSFNAFVEKVMDYFGYLSYSARKRIVCGSMAKEGLEQKTDLGLSCELVTSGKGNACRCS